MSVKAMGRVWDADLPPNHKLVLLAYADAAEHDGTQSYPGWERLAAMTGYSRRQVDRITEELIGLGVLARVRDGRRGQRAEFHVLLDALAVVSQSDPLDEEDSETSESSNVSPSVLPVREDLLPTVVDLGERRRDDVWDALAQFFGEPTTEGNRKLRGKIVRSLKRADATGEEVKARIAAWPFHFSVTLTETALEKHWDRLGRPPARMSEADVDAYQAELQRQQRLHRAAVLDAELRGLPE